MTYHVDGEAAISRLVLLVVRVLFALVTDFDVHQVVLWVAKDSVCAGDESGQEGLNLLQDIALLDHREVWLRRRLCKQTFNHLNASLLFHCFKCNQTRRLLIQ